jgi:hypothetical protein
MLVKIAHDPGSGRAKKNAKRCLTGKRESVTKTVAAAGGVKKSLTGEKPTHLTATAKRL